MKAGRLRKETEAKYPRIKRLFKELLVKDRVILRGKRILIPEELRRSVMVAGHEGQVGMYTMVRQLRSSVWWLGIEQNVKQ